MRFLAITIGDPSSGSTRFRIMQYRQLFEDQGIELQVKEKAAFSRSGLDGTGRPDWIMNQKCLLSLSAVRTVRRTGARLLFDFDDAIYTRPGRPFSLWARLRVRHRLRAWLRAADVVTTANRYLADFAKPYARRVEVLPMALDLRVWRPEKRPTDEAVRIGWAGAPNNLHHLERLEPVLGKIMQQFPQVQLSVCSGKRPNLSLPFVYTPFDTGVDCRFIQGLDVGLLPLTDEEYSRGKSPIKALQYLACAVPVVGNMYGATKEICLPGHSVAVESEASWINGLTRLIEEKALREHMGLAGRAFIEKHHDAQRVGTRFIRILND